MGPSAASRNYYYIAKKKKKAVVYYTLENRYPFFLLFPEMKKTFFFNKFIRGIFFFFKTSGIVLEYLSEESSESYLKTENYYDVRIAGKGQKLVWYIWTVPHIFILFTVAASATDVSVDRRWKDLLYIYYSRNSVISFLFSSFLSFSLQREKIKTI